MPTRRILKTAGILAGFALAVVLAFFAAKEIQSYRAATARSATKDDLNRIMVAMHQYYGAYDTFPPAFTIGSDGKRWHSWRALILPYLEPELARQYHFDEPWDGPTNSKLLVHAPDVYRSDGVDPPANVTSYLAVVGKKTLWPADESLGIRDIWDGTFQMVWLQLRDEIGGPVQLDEKSPMADALNASHFKQEIPIACRHQRQS